MKIQMQGVSAAPLNSDFSRKTWTQLNLDGPILAPTVPTKLDDPNLEAAEIRERERPPMVTLPEYRRKRDLLMVEEKETYSR